MINLQKSPIINIDKNQDEVFTELHIDGLQGDLVRVSIHEGYGQQKLPTGGSSINERKSRLMPRLGPGEKLLIPVAPGPRAT
ncbi:MAG: hypothetical protein P8016_07395 [Sedimentisphaerales bacterium]